MSRVTVLIRIGGVIQEIPRRVICVTHAHPAGYGEIRPDIAHIRPDIIYIWPDVCCHLLEYCVTQVISGGTWKSTAGHNSHPAGCYIHMAGYVFITLVSDSER